ncbi:hypothetical protein AVT69_gp102 [Pseudomonas phage PhiPA3]|uniref:Uncharacterized protein 103 n=1 Tax=Pseudomonas phage PhiPA3 TaxID=998086 RepID=F8SJY0_BPPA3|nr:hypothetical protein AVT69_gp102 [Pseudomonas phage PhiPA3]AEH03527.1 hypothetical protein [Pseudomonas phage PhiPA3]
MPDLMILELEVYLMPSATVPLPDVYETITRKVAVDVVRQVAQYMTLPEQTEVYLPGRSDTVPMNDGMFGNCCDTANAVHFDPEERVTITYDEVAEENFTLSTAVMNNENFPVFYDETRDVIMRPIRRFVDFRIDFEYQAPNVVLAQRWLDDQRIRLSSGVGDLTMSLTYHYNVPPALLGLMKGLYDTMQNSCWPTEWTFREWMEKYWAQPQTEMTTLIGTHPTLTIYERQVDVVGHFDFINSPETPQQSSDKAGGYTVNFSYICRYERPTHIRVTYPMIMHQCPIPKVFRPKPIYENYQQADRKVTNLRGSLEKALILMRSRGVDYIQHPDTDDWHTDDKPIQRFTFFNGLLCLDKDDPTQLLDLSKLGRFTFTGWWLEFFKQEGAHAIADGSFFEFRLYQNNQRIRVPLTIDPGTLIVRSTMPLDPHRYYHIQISLVKNLYAINDRYWRCISRYPTCCWQLFHLFNLGIGKRPIEQMELLGLSGPRPPEGDCGEEGKTEYVKDIPHFPRGIVKWGDIAEARDEQDKNIIGGPGESGYVNQNTFGPTNVLFANIISERKS